MKTLKLSLARAGVAALAFGALVGAPTAALAKTSFQSGSACVPARADKGKINFSTKAGALNDSTTSGGTVYCPFIYQTRDFDGVPFEIQIRTVDQNPSADISCTLAGMNFDGSIGFAPATQKTSGASSNQDWLPFDNLPNHLTYAASCSIPAKVNSLASAVTGFGMIFLD
jgi:hypothetical protein